MRKTFFIALIVLVAGVSIVFAQSRLRRKTASVTITSAGAIQIVPTAGQTVSVTGPATVSTTLGVTGASTLTGGVTVGTGNALTKIAKYTAVLSPAEVGASTCAEELFTVTGITANDIVFVNKPTAQAGLGVAGVRASAADQVGITFCNATAAPITPTATQTYLFGAIR